MRKATLGVVGILAVLAAADSKPGSATYVTDGDVQATLKRAPENSVSDQQIRVIDVGKVNVAVGAVYRSAKAPQLAVEHDQTTEIYHIMDGSWDLVTRAPVSSPAACAP